MWLVPRPDMRICLILLSGGFGSLLATSSTGQLYGANNGVLCIHQFKTIEVQVGNLHGLTKAEVINVDDNALRDLGVDCTYFDFLH